MQGEEIKNTLLAEAVAQMATLPGVGRKTALRFVLHLLKQPPEHVDQFAEALIHLKHNIRYCKRCNNIATSDRCEICNDTSRNQSIICVVSEIQDVLIIENTGEYKGSYFVLGGVISPMDGIGPKDIAVDTLIERVNKEHPKEIIMALPTTIEGDTTSFYIYKKLEHFIVNEHLILTQIARGISIGNELGFTDEMTLAKSFINRVIYDGGQNYKTT